MIWSLKLVGLPSAGEKSKPHDYKQSRKNEGPFENMGFKVKTVWRFQTETRTKTKLSTFKKPQCNTRAINTTIEYGSRKTVRIKLNKTWKKSFRSHLLELCKTRSKKSSPDMLNFYVILAGHDMITEAGRVTMCRWKIKAPWLQTK